MIKLTTCLLGILLALYANCEVLERSQNEVTFMLPDDCLSFANCLIMSTVSRINSSNQFEFDGQSGSDISQTATYAAIGLSIHTYTQDSAVECDLSNDVIDVFLSYTQQSSRGDSRHKPNDDIRVVYRSYTNGILHCVYEWQNRTAIDDEMFVTQKLSYHLLPAKENTEYVISSTRHGNGRTSFLVPINGRQASSDDIDYDRCGKTQTCFGMPSGCLQSQNCHTAIAVSYTSPTYLFQLMTTMGTRYVAVALSDDRLMADDSVIECVRESNIVNMYTSYTRVDYTGTDRHDSNGVATLVNSSYANGKINCYVERNNYNVINEREFDLDHQRFYILMAIGDDATATEILEHKERELSSQAIHLQDIVSLTRANKPILIALHGCFMIVAWMGTAAIGLVLARYFKNDWSGRQLFGKDIWFVGHMACMVITWILTIAAFVLIFVHVGGWTIIGHNHGILGTIVTAFCFFQSFGALFRPSPHHEKRYYFNNGHYFGGRIAFLLAIVTIFLSIFISSAEMPYWFIAIMVLFSIVFWGNHILMGTMLYLIGNERGMCSLVKSMIGPAKRINVKQNHSAWYIRMKVKIFLIYSAVITAFVIAGVLVVLLYRK